MNEATNDLNQLLSVLIPNDAQRDHIAKFLMVAIRNGLITNVQYFEVGEENES